MHHFSWRPWKNRYMHICVSKEKEPSPSADAGRGEAHGIYLFGSDNVQKYVNVPLDKRLFFIKAQFDSETNKLYNQG